MGLYAIHFDVLDPRHMRGVERDELIPPPSDGARRSKVTEKLPFRYWQIWGDTPMISQKSDSPIPPAERAELIAGTADPGGA